MKTIELINMNKYILLLILYLFATSSLHSQVSKDEAGILVNNYLKKEIIGSRLYQKDSISLPNSIINTFHKEIRTAEFKSWAFFLDKNPLAGWEHPCSYIFVDALTGNLLEKTWKMPPNDIENWSSLNEKQEYSSTKLFDFSKFKSSAKKSGINTENCYAVIISGGKNRWNNPSRYWNDCSAIYSTLVNVYGYEDDHIYSLISDGTDPSNDRKIDGGYDSSPLDLDGDGDHDTQYAATCDDISDVFDELSQILDEDDYLFIFTTDHGGQQSGSDVYMLLWGYYEVMTDDEFADEVDKV